MVTAPNRLDVNRGSIYRCAWAIGIGVLGVVMVHHPMILSGFARIQTDLGDSRLIHYLLEHSYRWARREPGHSDLWSPPFFYPAANAGAYSDLLVGVGPVYWLWRVMGASPDLAFGLWMVSMSVMNYAAGLLLFGRGLGFSMSAAAAGASLVAFGAPRANQLNHQQLLPCFYVLLAVYALARLAGDRSMGWRARAAYWLLAVSAAVAQLYSGVYLGLILIFGLLLATTAALILRTCRPVVVQVVWRDLWAIAVAGTVGLLLLQPFLAHYLRAATDRSPDFSVLNALHPHTWSWWDVGSGNWLWGWMASRGIFRGLRSTPEHHLGFGVLTTLVCAAGLYMSRERPICRLAALVTFVFWLATTYLPGDAIAILAAGISYYCVAGLFQESDDLRSLATGLAAVLGWLALVRLPTSYLELLGLVTIVLCSLEIYRRRGHPQTQIVAGIGLLALSLSAFGLPVIVHGLIIIAPVAGLLAYYYRWNWRDVGLGALAALVAFSLVITLLDRPGMLVSVLAVTPASLAVSAPRRFRPPAWLMRQGLLIALPLLTLFLHCDSLWLGYYRLIPGAIAIRAVGRVVLIMLIPMALGLTCLVWLLERKRWALAGGIVALACLAEQAVTTDTFDAAANRATVAGIARRVDRGKVAFYYRPCDDPSGYPYDHLDAMWASLESGVPTINGYSGYAPREWEGFFLAEYKPEIEVEDILADWERTQGLPPDRVQFIGADCLRKRAVHSAAMRGEPTFPGAIAGRDELSFQPNNSRITWASSTRR
jgi:hypothetical protein